MTYGVAATPFTAQAYEQLISTLLQNKDADYAVFHARLIRADLHNIGVRTPVLRAIAKELASGDWRGFLACCKNDYYEEAVLYGLVVGLTKTDFAEHLACLSEFIPRIDNWATNDITAGSMKWIAKDKAQMLPFIKEALQKSGEYEVRFAVTLLLSFYITDEYIDEVLPLLDAVSHEGYYVKMAVAWTTAECYIKFREKTKAFLSTASFDDFTFRKTIQKICESRRISPEEKALLRTQKRK